MTPTVEDILELIESAAPAHLAEPWDNPGLQVGDRAKRVQKMLLALDPTPRAIHAAASHHAQLLFTHHPLIFKPLSHLEPSFYPGDVIFEAVQTNIAVVCAHTNLDAAPGGINDTLAGLLGLQHIHLLAEQDGRPGIGLGRIGRLPAPISLSDLAEEVKTTLGAELVTVVGAPEKVLRRAAVVGGSGGDLIRHAHKKGADVLITGDISHHKALEASFLGLALIDAGHYHTERAAFAAFGTHLKEMVRERRWDLDIIWDSNEENPARAI